MPVAFLAGLLRSRVGRFGVAELVVELTAAPPAASCATTWPARSAIGRSSWGSGCPRGPGSRTWTAALSSPGARVGPGGDAGRAHGRPIAALIMTPRWSRTPN